MRQSVPPNKCAKMTRQNILPWKSAGFTARITRRIYSPEKSAISTRGLLARDPPFPAQNPQAGPGPPTLPPPHSSANGAAGGRGQGGDPAHPRILNRYFYFLSPFHEWLHILIWHDTHIFYTERIKVKYEYIAVGEGIIARKGWGAGLLPAPCKGLFA
jgi:hypothetical protein